MKAVIQRVSHSKLKVGKRTVRFVQFSDPNENGKKGMMGEILRYLLKARKDTRNKIKYKTIITEDNSEYIGLYDKNPFFQCFPI